MRLRAEDIRVGNILKVMIPENKGLYKVEGVATNIVTTKIKLEGIKELVNINQCEPEPITENWLGLFGFEMLKSADSSSLVKWWFGKYVIDYSHGVSTLSVFDGSELKYLLSLNYVHELQNAFYVLTKDILTTVI